MITTAYVDLGVSLGLRGLPVENDLLAITSAYSRGLRPGSKMCAEHMENWQYLSLGDLEKKKLFPRSKSSGFLVS